MNDEYDKTKRIAEDRTMDSPGFQMKPEAESLGNTAANKGTQQDLSEIGDWAMTDPEVDIPPETKADEWKMPEPVFRVSDGKTAESRKTPQNNFPFSKSPLPEEIETTKPIQPQPNISEEFTINHVIEKKPAQAEPKGFSTTVLILAFAAMIVFAIVFLVVVYSLFFYKPAP